VLVYAVMNLRVLWSAGNILTSWVPVSFSGRTLLHGVNELRISYISHAYETRPSHSPTIIVKG
jgi:hypothetical protein